MPSINWNMAIRRGTALSLFTDNTVLLDEEIGVESDTRLFKLGDGVTAWNDLPYSSAVHANSIWIGLSADVGNLLEVSATDHGFKLDPAKLNALSVFDQAYAGTIVDLLNYEGADQHKAAAVRAGILLRAVVTAMGANYTGLLSGGVPSTTVTAALTAIQDQITAMNGGGAHISDGTTTTTETWSSNKINSQIGSAIATLVDTTPATLDTLAELATALGNNPNFATTVATELGNCVKIVTQSFTEPQKLQARSNIDAVAATDVINKTGGTLTGPLNQAVHATIASASFIDIGAASSNNITITGAAAIVNLGTIVDGATRTLTFTAALVLTHNITNIILPTGSNIATEAGDIADFVSLGSGTWRCTNYQRASGVPIAPVKTVSGKSIFGMGDIAGGMIPTAVKSIAYTAVANDMVRVDPTAAAFTVSLPAAPADGDLVGVFDVTNKCGLNAVLLAPLGGKTVEGDAAGLSVDVSGSFVVVMYNAATGNWKLQMTPLQAGGILALANGGTGAATPSTALAALGGAPVDGFTVQQIAGITQLAVKNVHYVIVNVAATEVKMPPTPAEGDTVVVTVDNGLITNTMNFNGKNHENSTDVTMAIDNSRATITWRFLNNKWRII